MSPQTRRAELFSRAKVSRDGKKGEKRNVGAPADGFGDPALLLVAPEQGGKNPGPVQPAQRLDPAFGKPALGRPGRADVEDHRAAARLPTRSGEPVLSRTDQDPPGWSEENGPLLLDAEKLQELQVFKDDMVVLGKRGRFFGVKPAGHRLAEIAGPNPSRRREPESRPIQADFRSPWKSRAIRSRSRRFFLQPGSPTTMISSRPSTRSRISRPFGSTTQEIRASGLAPAQGGEGRNGVDDVAERAQADDQEYSFIAPDDGRRGAASFGPECGE